MLSTTAVVLILLVIDSVPVSHSQISPDADLNRPSLGPALGSQANFLQPNFEYAPAVQTQEPEIAYDRFDFQLLRGFASLNENVLISPLSIKTTLAMILEGAHGKSAREIQMALRIGGSEQGKIRAYLAQLLQQLRKTQYLDIYNSVFVSNKVRIMSGYQQQVHTNYKAVIEAVDFANVDRAVAQINRWVNEVTRGAIPSIVTADSVHRDSVVLIANALFFKGKWDTAFDDKSTRLDNFFGTGGKQLVQMMQVTNNFNYTNYLHSDIIDLPYQQDFSMLVIMPGEYTNIANLADDIHDLGAILDRLNSTEINLSMPKFEMDYSRDLIDVLKAMGVQTVFSAESNLTGIVNQAGVNAQVNQIVHKTKIEVDENGTKAAAATGALVIPLIGSTAKRVIINKPFIFFIYHRPTRTIIFEGIFRQPSQIVSGGQQPQQQQKRQPINTQSRVAYVNY